MKEARSTSFSPTDFSTRYNFPSTKILGQEMHLAYGGDLESDTLLYAYSHGFFPWYDEEPIQWCSPPLRTILGKGELHIGGSTRRALNKKLFVLTKNRAFEKVIGQCATLHGATWITPEMKEAYVKLHDAGWAHSWEAWADGTLVGGLYGVKIGRAVFLESTFHRQENAGKAAFVFMFKEMEGAGVELFDFQVESALAMSFGAYEVMRAEYEAKLLRALS